MKPKGDRPHLRYLLDRRSHLAYRRLMKTLNNSFAFESSDVAKYRLKVIEFYYKYGLAPMQDAFEVKTSTFYDWLNAYEGSGKQLLSLVPVSTRPKSVRKMETDWRLVTFIKAYRKEHGNVGARIIKPFLDAFAEEMGIDTIGRTTIEKVIRRRKFTFESRGKSGRKRKTDKKRVNKAPRQKESGYIEADTIEIRLFGKKYYFLSIIDVYTRYAYVELIKRRASKYTKEAFIRFQQQYQYDVHTVQTDNGSEFFKLFHKYLDEQEITHNFIYPGMPKINGIVERFNRTVQEEYINRSDYFGINDEKFKEKLTKYVNWYNQKRPHSSLGYQSPMQFMNL